jgi:accessory gene regulator protein AgrB
VIWLPMKNGFGFRMVSRFMFVHGRKKIMMGILRFLVFGLITAYFAQRKGYNPLCWILSGGLVGLAVVAFLPNIKQMESDEETKKAKLKKGNTIGIVMSAIIVVLTVVLSIMLAQAQ